MAISNVFSWLVAALVMLSFQTTAIAKSVNDPSGVWQTYDHKTGNPKAHVRIAYNKKTQSYIGHIAKVTPAAGYTPKKYCQNCPKPFTNKKIDGLMVIWNLKAIKNSSGKITGYDNGYILNPLNGKIYRLKLQVSKNDRILKTRAYKGVAMIGRSQTWKRVK